MHTLLIAENAEERELITQSLRQTGMQMLAQKDAASLLDYTLQKPVDLVVITSETFPSAIELVKAIRAQIRIPLIIICNAITEQEHCELLDKGADMVFVRPVATRLFSRYTKILLRKATGVPPALLDPIKSASVVLDPGRRAVLVKTKDQAEHLVRLTQLEFRLLYVLMTNEGQVMPTEELVEKVWGYSGEGNRDLVRGLVRRLRRKIEVHNDESKKDAVNLIQNLPGVGYRFNMEEE